MRRYLLPIIVGVAILWSARSWAEETVVTLQQGQGGYSGCEDATLSGLAPTANFGGSSYVRTWRGSGTSVPRQNRHAVLKFDLSSVPSDKYIISARLEVYCYQLDYPSAAPKVSAKMVKRSWAEGSGDGAVGVPGATWIEWDYLDHDATSQNDWTERGGDFDNTVLDTQPVAAGQWTSLDVTAAVRSIVFGVSPNDGLAVVPADEGSGVNDARYYSSEYAADASLRPRLVVTYTDGDPNPPPVPPAPPSWKLVLQQGLDGYAGCADATASGVHPTLNSGGSRTLGTWRGSSTDNPRKDKNALVRFDLSSIPSNQAVLQAKLEVYCTALSYPSSAPKVSVKTISRSWVEGSGASVAGVPGVTWYEWDYFDHDATAQNDWAARGGDFGAEALDSKPIAAGQWTSLDVTAAVQAMHAGQAENHGFAIVPFAEGSGVNDALYCSSEHEFDTSLRPRLVLVVAELEELAFQAGDGGAHSKTEDAYIESNYPTVPHVSGSYLVAGKSGDATKCSLVRFPEVIGKAAEQIPHDAVIVEAKLRLTTTYGKDVPISAYAITDGWTFGTALSPTWSQRRLALTGWTVAGCGYTDENTKSREATAQDTKTPLQSYTGYEWDVTQAMQAWVNDADLNRGIVFENRAGADLEAFYSSHVQEFPAYHPMLKVKFYRVDLQAPKLTITSPLTSQTKKAFVEGAKDPEVDTISLTASGVSVPVTVTGATKWHAFVERGSSDSVQLVATSLDADGNTTVVERTLVFSPLDAASNGGLIMQAGDSALIALTSFDPEAASVEIDPGNGATTVVGGLGTTLEVPYPSAGEYTAVCQVLDAENNVIGSYSVSVAAITVIMKPGHALGIRTSQFYNPTVQYEVEVTPVSAKDQVHLLTDNEDMLTVQPRETSDAGVKSTIVLEKLANSFIQSRFGGLSGRLLAREEVLGFVAGCTTLFGDTSSRQGTAHMVFSPLIVGLEVEVSLGFGATYEDGSVAKTFYTSQADENGYISLGPIIVPGTAPHFETTIRTYQYFSPRKQVGGNYWNKGIAYLGITEQAFALGKIPTGATVIGLKAAPYHDGKEVAGTLPEHLLVSLRLIKDGEGPPEDPAKPGGVSSGQAFFPTSLAAPVDFPQADDSAPPVPANLAVGVYNLWAWDEPTPPEGACEARHEWVPFPAAVTVVQNDDTLVVVDRKAKRRAEDPGASALYVAQDVQSRVEMALSFVRKADDTDSYQWQITTDEVGAEPLDDVVNPRGSFDGSKFAPWTWRERVPKPGGGEYVMPREIYVHSWKLVNDVKINKRKVKVVVIKVAMKRRVPGEADYKLIGDSNSNRHVLPGQKMDLKAEIELPTGLAVSGYSWKLPGTTFRHYAADADGATLLQLYSNHLNAVTVEFYWADSGTEREVQCELTVDGQPVTGRARMNVASAPYNLAAKRGVIRKITLKGVKYIALAPPGQQEGRGIAWTATVALPTGMTGAAKWRFVQVVRPGRIRVHNQLGGGTQNRFHNLHGQWVGEETHPYAPEPPQDSWPLGTQSSGDSPGMAHEPDPPPREQAWRRSKLRRVACC